MTLALRELLRRPGRFAVATAVLAVLAILLMFLGGLLDGLTDASTGAYRAQRADLLVYSSEARQSLVRSRNDPATATNVAATPGVAAVGAIGTVQLGARRGADPQGDHLISATVVGYQLAPRGLPAQPPARGTAIADSAVKADGVGEGDVLLLGPQRTPITVVGFVDDTRYSGQVTLWASLDTWRDVTAANRPDRAFTDGSVTALVVRADSDERPVALAGAIDAATGRTESLTIAEATDALPGVRQQRSTFNQIISVTAVIAVLVVALFFALITVERISLYGILKAIGASGRTLFGGLVVQAVVITLVASTIGAGAALLLDALIPPGGIPFDISARRLLVSVALMVGAAVIGSAFSLRRVLRIDPAAAIGAGA